jgi:hypothetical protein
MSLFTWLRNRTSIQSPRGRAQHRLGAPRFCPQLEALENRCVPSTLTVTNYLDSGPGSLRAEIAAANSGDTIVFSGSTTLTSGEVVINKSLTIQGSGYISGGDFFTSTGVGSGSRVFEVDGAGSNVTLSGLHIIQGAGVVAHGSSHAGDGEGGGILNYGTLTLTNCTLSDNTANSLNGGTGPFLGGAVYNAGTLTLSGCTLTSNSVGHLNNGGYGNGGAIYNAGTLSVSNCALSGNTAVGVLYGDGSPTDVGNGGAIYSAYKATATITGSQFEQNTAYAGGGGIWNNGTMTVSGCYVHYNYAGLGGGIFNGRSGKLTIQSSNVGGNSGTNNGIGWDLYGFGQVKISKDSYVGNIGP